MHAILAESLTKWHQETPYSQPDHWVFPSFRLKGKKPRCASTLVADRLRCAAVKAGVLAKDDARRFGFHNLRHSLASFLVRIRTDPLVRIRTDPKTVQTLLRHSNVKTTLQLLCSQRVRRSDGGAGIGAGGVLATAGEYYCELNHGLRLGREN
jgi:integrase